MFHLARARAKTCTLCQTGAGLVFHSLHNNISGSLQGLTSVRMKTGEIYNRSLPIDIDVPNPGAFRGLKKIDTTSEKPFNGLLARVVSHDNSSYEGEWRNGVKHGLGVHIFADGGFFDGVFNNGKYWTGKGRMVFPSGDSYDGKWLNGLKHGEGVLRSANGTLKFKGIFNKNSAYTGSGLLERSKYRYEGEVLRGRLHGVGTITYIDGSTYSGKWVDGKKEGEGTSTTASGASFVGTFKNDVPWVGQGTVSVPADVGVCYMGQWGFGKMHGLGMLLQATGVEFVSKWVMGRPHGRGVVKYPSGRRVTVQHDNGIPMFPAPTFHLPAPVGESSKAGDSSSSNNTNNEISSGGSSYNGLAVLRNGDSYNGHWGPGGVIHGEGEYSVFTVVDGKAGEVRYQGNWTHGVKDGVFRVTRVAAGTGSKPVTCSSTETWVNGVLQL
jgi:hypothetical protein